MALTAKPPQSFFYRMFRRDIGRKGIAAVLALIVFSSIDRQVRDEQIKTVTVQFADAGTEERLNPGGSNWVLVVVQRGESRVIAVKGGKNPSQFRLRLSGTRNAISEAIQSPRKLLWRPSFAGDVSLTGEDLDLDRVAADLGTGGAVEIVDDVTFHLAEEDERKLTLGPEHLRIVGEPESGWRFDDDPKWTAFQPRQVTLRGPRSHLERIDGETTGEPLFAVDVTGQSDRVEVSDLPLLDENLSFADTSRVSARIRLVENMVPLTGDDAIFEKTVQIVDPDPEFLTQVLKQKWELGQRPHFTNKDDISRDLQIVAPEGFRKNPDGAAIREANQYVALFVRVQELNTEEPIDVKIQIHKFPGFPPNLDVRFLDVENNSDVIEVAWRGDDP